MAGYNRTPWGKQLQRDKNQEEYAIKLSLVADKQCNLCRVSMKDILLRSLSSSHNLHEVEEHHCKRCNMHLLQTCITQAPCCLNREPCAHYIHISYTLITSKEFRTQGKTPISTCTVIYLNWRERIHRKVQRYKLVSQCHVW